MSWKDGPVSHLEPTAEVLLIVQKAAITPRTASRELVVAGVTAAVGRMVAGQRV